jgi:hypothetical protein
MVSNSYLKNRNGNYSLRFRIPSDLSPLLQQAEIVKSLKTSNLKTAKVSALPYVQGITQTFSLFRSGFITTDQAIERLESLIGKKCRSKHSGDVEVSQRACMEPVLVSPVGSILSEFINT